MIEFGSEFVTVGCLLVVIDIALPDTALPYLWRDQWASVDD